VEDAADEADAPVSDAIAAATKTHQNAVSEAAPTTPPPTPKPTEGAPVPAGTWLSNVVQTHCIIDGVTLAHFGSAAQDGVRVAFARALGVHRGQVALSGVAARDTVSSAGAVGFAVAVTVSRAAAAGPIASINAARADPAQFRTLVRDEIAASVAGAGGDASALAGAVITVVTPPLLGNNAPPPTPAPTPPPTPAPTPAKAATWGPCAHVTCKTREVTIGQASHTFIVVEHHHLDHHNEHRCFIPDKTKGGACTCLCRGLHGELAYAAVLK